MQCPVDMSARMMSAWVFDREEWMERNPSMRNTSAFDAITLLHCSVHACKRQILAMPVQAAHGCSFDVAQNMLTW